jgi:molybdopterin synthase catalytic subunit
MHPLTHTSITNQPIKAEDITTFLNNPEHGAVDIFIGKVRNLNMGRQVTGITYDVFDEHAIAVFNELCVLARKAYGEDIGIYISHFKGHLGINDISIAIGVSSKHRDESFRACRYLIEILKHRAPIWKQEHYIDGNSEWVQGHALCSHGCTNHVKTHAAQ